MHIICMYNERGEKENVSGQKMKAYIKDYDLVHCNDDAES